MAKIKNRAWVSTSTVGIGTLTLDSPVSGYQSFAAAGIVDNDVVQYVIVDGVEWEIGTGTYSSTGPTLTRTVLESTNSNNPVSLSGSATVFISPSAADIPVLSEPNVFQRTVAGKVFALTSNTAWDGGRQVLSVTVNGGNFTIANPISATLIVGAYYTFYISYTTAHTLAFGSNLTGIAAKNISWSATAGVKDHLVMRASSSSVLEYISHTLNCSGA
jgi:hypothetical protein